MFKESEHIFTDGDDLENALFRSLKGVQETLDNNFREYSSQKQVAVDKMIFEGLIEEEACCDLGKNRAGFEFSRN